MAATIDRATLDWATLDRATLDRATLDRLIALRHAQGGLTAGDQQAMLPVDALGVDALVLVMLDLEAAGEEAVGRMVLLAGLAVLPVVGTVLILNRGGVRGGGTSPILAPRHRPARRTGAQPPRSTPRRSTARGEPVRASRSAWTRAPASGVSTPPRCGATSCGSGRPVTPASRSASRPRCALFAR